MRIGEVLNLRMKDVEGCKLFLVSPKSGRQNEVVFIPKKVAARLRDYIRSKKMEPAFMPSTAQAVSRFPLSLSQDWPRFLVLMLTLTFRTSSAVRLRSSF